MNQPKLELKFDPNQEYQLDAITSITALFEELPRQYIEEAVTSGLEIVANMPPYEMLDETTLSDYLNTIQRDFNAKAEARNDIHSKIKPKAFDLEIDDGLMLDGISHNSWRSPHFSVEMETGTGKTYVYLRTIYELRKQYGFRKFIIVVPSRAIFEGVVKSFQITQEHFRGLYGNETVNLFRYDSGQISRLRSFATQPFTDIMVMTLDSFNKKSNNIFKSTEKLSGEKLPYQYIQGTRPIIILDEPQNMESEISKQAIRTLSPLFVLRYSATHRSTPNLVYRLTPFEAYRLNLVKKIQVYGVSETDDANRPFLSLVKLSKPGATPITATVATHRNDRGTTKPTEIPLTGKSDLQKLTNREEFAGYVVEEIHTGDKFVKFSNGITLHLNDTIGYNRQAIFREQIKQTIKTHMEQQQWLHQKDIKVLSLFFIDRVANYVNDDGLIKTIFDEEFEKLKPGYALFKDKQAAQVREGYFASRKAKDNPNGFEWVDTALDETQKKQADREAEQAAYELIMKKKERLLSFDEPVSFIFAHSALKEGWDNPNVFQICTLNQTVSPIRKRQEIGRGLRICVDQTGERIFDDQINVLTVVANDKYENYAKTLQQEYAEDGLDAPPAPTNARANEIKRNDTLFGREEFTKFWEKLTQQTTYNIEVDTPALIKACIGRVNKTPIPEPKLVVQRGEFVRTQYTIKLEAVQGTQAKISVRISDTDGNLNEKRLTCTKSTDLAKEFKDQRLNGYKVTTILAQPTPTVIFANNEELTTLEPIIFESEAGQKIRATEVKSTPQTYPIFNLLERTVKETGLTRPTINQIFKGLDPSKKAHIFSNPEGFASVFITELRNGLAEHVANQIDFQLTGTTKEYDVEELFPQVKKFPQGLLIDAGNNSLYNQVQTDSEVEQNFVTHHLKDKPQVLFYFKFPHKYKINFPKIIGNYNPDWGIIYLRNGQPHLELVRETKGTTNTSQLRFPQEERKIKCATKHFALIGLDYRVVTDKTNRWWESAPPETEQQEMD